MFTSEYNHSIDAKGRLIIPSEYRELLGETFTVTKGLDGCLFAYSNEEWEKFEQKLTSLPLMNKDARSLARYFSAGAKKVELDKQGRILLPANLREFAALEKDVVLAGVGSRVEIWNKDKWDAANDDIDIEAISTTVQSMGLTI